MAHLHRKQRNGKTIYRVRWRNGERDFTRYKDAQSFLRRLQSGDNPSRTKVSVLADAWLKAHVVSLSYNTRRGYHNHVDNYILPKIGKYVVDDLAVFDFASLIDDIGQRVSNTTANGVLRTLRSMIRWGRAKGHCTNTAIDSIKTLPTQPHEPRPRTPKEVLKAANACKHLRDKTLIIFAAYTGVRLGELLVLEWADIDFTNNVVHISKTARSHRVRDVKAPKNTQKRSAPILKPAIEALMQWREACPKDFKLVFPTSNDTRLGSTWRKTVIEKQIRSVVPDFQMNQMRDTYASLLVSAGYSPAEVCLFMGHSKIQTTLKYYVSQYGVSVDTAAKANELIDRMLSE